MLLLLITACAPKANTDSTTIKSALENSWSEYGVTMNFSQQNITAGTLNVSYPSGGVCQYNYTYDLAARTWTDDSGDGTIDIPAGTIITPAAGLNCSDLVGSWKYKVWNSSELEICTTTLTRCFDFF